MRMKNEKFAFHLEWSEYGYKISGLLWLCGDAWHGYLPIGTTPCKTSANYSCIFYCPNIFNTYHCIFHGSQIFGFKLCVIFLTHSTVENLSCSDFTICPFFYRVMSTRSCHIYLNFWAPSNNSGVPRDDETEEKKLVSFRLQFPRFGLGDGQRGGPDQFRSCVTNFEKLKMVFGSFL